MQATQRYTRDDMLNIRDKALNESYRGNNIKNRAIYNMLARNKRQKIEYVKNNIYNERRTIDSQ